MPALTLIILAAAALRLLFLARHELWFDEAFTWLFARQNFRTILGAVTADETNPPVYYLIMHGVIAVFGDSEMSLRLPSVLAAILIIPVVNQIGRQAIDRPGGLLAAAFVACNSMALFFAQEARAYALLATLDALIVLGLFRGITRDAAHATTVQRVWPWVLASLAAIVSIYTHYTALFFVAASYGVVLIYALVTRPDIRPDIRLWAASTAAIGLASIPAIRQAAALHHSAHIAWMTPPTPAGTLFLVGNVLGYPHFYATGPWADALLLVVSVVAVVAWRRRNPLCLLAAAILGAYLAILLIVSVTLTPLVLDRTIFPPAFVIALCVACAIRASGDAFGPTALRLTTHLGRRAVQLGVAIAIFAPALVSCWNYFAKPRRGNDFGTIATMVVRDNLTPVMVGPGIAYYLRRDAATMPLRLLVPGYSYLRLPGIATVDERQPFPETAPAGYAFIDVDEPLPNFLQGPGAIPTTQVGRQGRTLIERLTPAPL